LAGQLVDNGAVACPTPANQETRMELSRVAPELRGPMRQITRIPISMERS
jgi:hypothetical protein